MLDEYESNVVGDHVIVRVLVPPVSSAVPSSAAPQFVPAPHVSVEPAATGAASTDAADVPPSATAPSIVATDAAQQTPSVAVDSRLSSPPMLHLRPVYSWLAATVAAFVAELGVHILRFDDSRAALQSALHLIELVRDGRPTVPVILSPTTILEATDLHAM